MYLFWFLLCFALVMRLLYGILVLRYTSLSFSVLPTN